MRVRIGMAGLGEEVSYSEAEAREFIESGKFKTLVHDLAAYRKMVFDTFKAVDGYESLLVSKAKYGKDAAHAEMMLKVGFREYQRLKGLREGFEKIREQIGNTIPPDLFPNLQAADPEFASDFLFAMMGVRKIEDILPADRPLKFKKMETPSSDLKDLGVAWLLLVPALIFIVKAMAVLAVIVGAAIALKLLMDAYYKHQLEHRKLMAEVQQKIMQSAEVMFGAERKALEAEFKAGKIDGKTYRSELERIRKEQEAFVSGAFSQYVGAVKTTEAAPSWLKWAVIGGAGLLALAIFGPTLAEKARPQRKEVPQIA